MVGSKKKRYIGQSRQSVLYQKNCPAFRHARQTLQKKVAIISSRILPKTVRDLPGEPDMVVYQDNEMTRKLGMANRNDNDTNRLV